MLDFWAWRCKCAIKWARLSIHDIMCMVRNRVNGEHSAAIFGAELQQPNNFQHDFKMAEFPIVETLAPPRTQGGICNRSSTSTANNVLHQHVHGNKQHKHRSTQTLQNYNGHKQYTNIANITNSWVLNNITRHSTRTVHRKHLMTLVCAELCHLLVRLMQMRLQLLLQLVRLWRRWLACGYVCRWDHGSGCHIVKHATCSEVMLSETGKCAKSRWDFIC